MTDPQDGCTAVGEHLVPCALTGPHKHHFSRGLSWPNEEYVEPPGPKGGPGAVPLAEMASRVHESIKAAHQIPLSDPTINTMGVVGADHPETAVDAAFAVMPRTGTQRMAVLEAIRRAEAGLTDEEVRDLTGIRYSSECARRQELEKGGWVMASGLRRFTSSGQQAIVWVMTPRGRSRLS